MNTMKDYYNLRKNAKKNRKAKRKSNTLVNLDSLKQRYENHTNK